MSVIISPEIDTARLCLRRPIPADLDAWANYLADPTVLRYLPKRNITPRERAKFLYAAYLQGWQQDPVTDFGFVVALKGDNQLIGWCGVGETVEGNIAELVYSLGAPHWGKGIATEAAGAVVRYGFENTRWDAIGAAIVPQNTASRRVLEHLGFGYEKDVNYLELTGDTSIALDSPIVPYFMLRREQYVPPTTPYQVRMAAS